MITGYEIAAISTSGIVAVGLGLTWLRNGRNSATKYGELTNEVKNIGEKVDTLSVKVDNIDKKVSKIDTANSVLTERVKTHEREIGELKSK